ncbi:MAG: hypothetical protein JWO57_3125, partial [Pseudonocardiales bacterium]|nr:hypothetical protein [Pseudonocardiales bacterium]
HQLDDPTLETLATRRGYGGRHRAAAVGAAR